jgi:hypothetical protein
MLDNAIILENAFARLNKENKQLKIYFEGNLPLNENNWCKCKACHLFIEGILQSHNVSSSGFFHEFVLMHSKSDELARNSVPLIVGMSGRMKKFSKHLEDKEDLSKLLLMRSSWILVTR